MSFIKKFFQSWFRNLITILALASWYQGVIIPSGFWAASFIGLVLTLIQIFLEPLIKTLLLPINIITLGLFKWLLEVVVLLILAFIINGVEFKAFSYGAFSLFGFQFQAGEVSLIFSVILASIFYKFLQAIIKKLAS